ncbi:hypothetical protein [Streptomyces sp. NBC_00199]|nr:hypothetical protein [Streptomyces sp. NBC_00199]MCX5265711.1 hypothetical protein [Streptomyces sp. NBC_00199]
MPSSLRAARRSTLTLDGTTAGLSSATVTRHRDVVFVWADGIHPRKVRLG